VQQAKRFIKQLYYLQGQAEHEGGRVQVREELRAKEGGAEEVLLLLIVRYVCDVSYRYHKKGSVKT